MSYSLLLAFVLLYNDTTGALNVDWVILEYNMCATPHHTRLTPMPQAQTVNDLTVSLYNKTSAAPIKTHFDFTLQSKFGRLLLTALTWTKYICDIQS